MYFPTITSPPQNFNRFERLALKRIICAYSFIHLLSLSRGSRHKVAGTITVRWQRHRHGREPQTRREGREGVLVRVTVVAKF